MFQNKIALQMVGLSAVEKGVQALESREMAKAN